MTLYKDGYRTHSEEIELKPPWYLLFPLDIVSEIALPLLWRDKRSLEVTLVQGEERMSSPDLRSVLERAEILRRAGPEGPRNLPDPQPRQLPTASELASSLP